jgi:hypothetical protein
VALLASAKTLTEPPFWMLPGRTPAVSAGLIRFRPVLIETIGEVGGSSG